MKSSVLVIALMAGCGVPPAPETDMTIDPSIDAGADATVDAGAGGSGGADGGAPDSGPPVVCPVSIDPCYAVSSVGEECIFVPVPAGAQCETSGHVDHCNGYGHCGAATCDTDADCATSAPCFDVTCAANGPAVNTCVSVAIVTGECGKPCGAVVYGPESGACGEKSTTYHCERKGGPFSISGPCLALADGAPFVYCCPP